MINRKIVATLLISVGCVTSVALYEGFSPSTYKDAVGVPTIGYGHTGPEVKYGDKITRKEAKDLLVKDLNTHWNKAKKYIKVPLYQHEADAYASFTYNVGVSNFKKSTLLKLLNQGRYTEACGQLKKWVYAGGKKLNGLVKRRHSEYLRCMGKT